MNCPECSSNIGEPGFGLFKCPQCLTMIASRLSGVSIFNEEKRRTLNGRKTGQITRIKPKEGPRKILDLNCVGCFNPVDPATSRSGSIIRGLRFVSSPVTKTSPITRILIGTIDTWDRSYPIEKIEGGQSYRVNRTFGFFERVRGPLCEDCASNYHTIEDNRGKSHPIVIVDPLPGFNQRSLPDFDQTEGRDLKCAKERPQVSNSGSDNRQDNQWLNVGRRLSR